MKSAIELMIVRKVKELRLQSGTSMAALADPLDVNYQFISQIEDETSSKAYNIDHVNSIAKFFKCTLWELIPQKPI